MSMEGYGGMILTGENLRTRIKPVPVLLCPPQIPHRLTGVLTQASAVRGQRLTARAMARPKLSLIHAPIGKSINTSYQNRDYHNIFETLN
jgi:hypothetical protein